MKKLTKRIMALMLSLVMFIGCIPCNIANANDDKTLAEILPSGFPTDVKTGWMSEKGFTVFFDGDGLCFKEPKIGNKEFVGVTDFTINKDTTFTLSGEDYVATLYPDTDHPEKETVVKICLEDGEVDSIIVTSEYDRTGKYIADNDYRKLVKAINRTEPAGDSEVFTISDSGDERTIKFKKDIKLESALILSDGKKTILDLNGHILDRGLVNADGTFSYDKNGSVIEVNNNEKGTTLEIKDSNPDNPHVGAINSKGLWHPNASGESVTLYGGIITGGTGYYKSTTTGGGIRIMSDTKLIMNGANVCGNIADTSSSSFGAGIYSQGEAVLNDCNISYNYANIGGGIYALSSSTLEMNGGIVSYNISDHTSSAGGIYDYADTTLLNGVTIVGNKSVGLAGGIYINKSATLKGKVIIKDNINTALEDDGVTSRPHNLVVKNSININGLSNDSEIYFACLDNTYKQSAGVLTSGSNKNGLNKTVFYDGPDKFYADYDDNNEIAVIAVPEDTYKINALKSENGMIRPNKLCAQEGDEIILSPIPDVGYAFDEYIVEDEDGSPIEVVDDKFTMPGKTVYVSATFKEAPRTSSGSSKTYKAKDEDKTAEKISGSGKKGSTRTITPIEGKKVSSVIVKDKDGNKVDVTLNEDGTYSFVQPASDVTIEVNYKNREITLNIGSTEASVDGEKSNLDVSPVVRNDRTMLPIRFVAENLGAKVEWNEKKPDYVAITRGDTKIEITLGSDVMLVNGKEVKLDSVAFAENDRTYLPVRAISEALNAIVEWNEERPMEVKIYER